MSNSDSQVEVKIVGSLDGSVSASATAAKAQIASLSQASNGLGRSLQQEASAWSAQREATSTAATGLEEVTRAASASHGSVSTATREFRALFDELSSGRTRQTPGTLAIIGQRVLGLGPAALLAVGGVAALTAGLGYLALRAIEASNALALAKQAADFSGNSGLGTQQLEGAVTSLDQFANVSAKDAQQVIASFARMRDMSQPELDALARLVGEFAETQGQKAPEAAKIFIAALENEKLSAAELVKILPGITQEQINNIEQTQRLGNAHQTAAALLDVISSALQRTKQDFAEHSAGVFSSFKNYMAYVGALSSGVSIEQLHSQIVEDQTKKWDKNQAAILADIEALKKLAAQPPPQDLVDPINRTEDAIAKLDSTWTGSTAARYAAEAQLWQKTAAGTDVNAKQRAEAERRADEATFHSHQAQAQETTRLTKEANAEQIRSIEEEALGAQRGSAEQIAAYQKLYDTAVRLDGARSQQALSAERELMAARAAAAEEWLSELSQVETEAIARDNERADQSLRNIQDEFRERQISAAQEIQQAQDVESERYRLTQNSLQTLSALWAGYPQKIDEINKQIEANERTHEKNLDSIARGGARDMQQEYEQAWQPILNGFDTMVDGIMSGNETLVQVLGRGAITIAQDWIREQLRQVEQAIVGEQAKVAAVSAGTATRAGIQETAAASENAGFLLRAARWIASELGMTSATTAAEATRTASATAAAATQHATQSALNVASAESYAGVASAAAASAVAGIPIVGPELAVAAAASTLAALQPMVAMAALDTGTNFVPSDMVALIHQGERVIPAADNSALMNLMAQSGRDRSPGGAGGDVHLHYNPVIHGTQPVDVMQELRSNSRDLVLLIKRLARDGALNMAT